MASGRLGAVALPSNTYTVCYTVQSGMLATVNFGIASRTANSVAIDVALEASATTAPAAKSIIESGVTLAANAVLERTAIVMAAGQSLVARAASGSAASFVVWGMEESAS